MIGALLLATTLGLDRRDYYPHWFDTTIAGYKFATDPKHGDIAIHDPKRDFYLIRQMECDGADLTLTLTRDRRELLDLGFAIPGSGGDLRGMRTFVDNPLPSLATGKGVSIGDSESKIIKLLGGPSKKETSEPHYQRQSAWGTVHVVSHLLTYKFQKHRANGAVDFDQTYTFQGNKLVEISFSWSPDQ